MNATEKTIENIRNEFAEVSFPLHCGLHAAVAKDDWVSDEKTLREITSQKDYIGSWWDVPRDHLHQCMTALSYLDAAGIEFYLPAYMTAAIESPELFDIPGKRSSSWLIVITMTPDTEDSTLLEYFLDRFSRIIGSKKQVCREFLEHIACHDDYSEHARELALAALASKFWSTNSSTEPDECGK